MTKCQVCGGPALVEPRLFPEAEDRWSCPRCGTWGTISYRREPDTPEPEPDPGENTSD